MYKIEPTYFFMRQSALLSSDAKLIVDAKIDMLKENPFRFKRLQYAGLLLFRIRFSDRRKEKRIIYTVQSDVVRLICILDRSRGYTDLRKYI